MRRLLILSCAALIAGLGLARVSSAALLQVTEHFDSNTDGYWDHLNNTTAPENYGWTNTNNAGGSPGELGGAVARLTSPANFYGFNIGSLNVSTDSFTVSGKIRSNAGDGAIYVGYFKGPSSYSGPSPSPGDGNNFMGLFLNDGREVYSRIWSKNSNSDPRRAAALDLTLNQATTFGITYDPNGGPNGFGQMVLTVGANSFTHNLDNGWKGIIDNLTHFGVYPVNSTASNPSIVYLDDLTFTSANAIPEPATAGLLFSVGGVCLLRRRARQR